MRLAIFVDQVFWLDGSRLSTDESYILFPASFKEFVDEIVFIGRLSPATGRAPYPLEGGRFSLFAIPFYKNLYQFWRNDPRVYWEIAKAARQQAKTWDALLVCGPHPIGHIIARACIALGVPVLPIVRQNFIEQMSAHRGFKRLAALAAARTLEWDFRRIARDRTVFTVGKEMAAQYARLSGRVHNHFPCLVDSAQFEVFSKMSAGSDPTRLIKVCRLAPEKGHKYLFAALVELNQRGLRCHVDLVGTGPIEQELRAIVAKLGITEQVTFRGYVPYGPSLFDLYQKAGALVLSSTTEGFPQVINESLSIGLPTIATRVGGIPSFLTHGETALLVPPRDPSALANAIESFVHDAELRERLRNRGRALMRDNTLEANRDRILEGVREEIARQKA
jgi:glycosyltransferase involved in cell wall biosynthesis